MHENEIFQPSRLHENEIFHNFAKGGSRKKF